MADDDPRAANVLELVRTDLSGERTVLRVVAAVLRTDLDVVTQHTQRHRDVDVRDAKYNVDVGGDRSGLVKDLDPFDVLIVQSVAFPVTTDQVPAGSSDRVFGRRSLGTVSLESFPG